MRALHEAGSEVVGLVRPGSRSPRLEGLTEHVELVAVDVADGPALDDAVARLRPDLAVNLVVAGTHPLTRDERMAQLEVSVLGTARLVEGLARSGCRRLVHLGSSLEYGPRSRPLREDDRLAPVVPRGIAKAAETTVCLGLAEGLGLSAVVLRPFSIYGPYEHDARLVPSAVRAAFDGTELPLTEPGLAHDFVYMGDVVRAIELALRGPSSLDACVFNIGSGTQTTNEELVELVGRVAGREVRTVRGAHPTRAHDTRDWVADIERARTELGWVPAVGLEAGLRATISWWQARAQAEAMSR